jgi:hypothetical protein
MDHRRLQLVKAPVRFFVCVQDHPIASLGCRKTVIFERSAGMKVENKKEA